MEIKKSIRILCQRPNCGGLMQPEYYQGQTDMICIRCGHYAYTK